MRSLATKLVAAMMAGIGSTSATAASPDSISLHELSSHTAQSHLLSTSDRA